MENKTEESIIVTIDDTEGNSRDFVQDMVIPFDGKEFAVLVSIPESARSPLKLKNMTLSLKSIMPCNYH